MNFLRHHDGVGGLLLFSVFGLHLLGSLRSRSWRGDGGRRRRIIFVVHEDVIVVKLDGRHGEGLRRWGICSEGHVRLVVVVG